MISDDEAIPLLFSKLKNNGYKLVNKSIDNIDEHQKYFGYISGSLTLVEKIKIVDLYNKGVIKVLIFTLSIKEGISFRETNNIIVFQPYWNFAIMNQILARGIRFDSHIMKNKSVINLHLLCAVKNKNKLIDWKNDVENVFNNNVENLHLPIKQIKKKVGKTMIDV